MGESLSQRLVLEKTRQKNKKTRHLLSVDLNKNLHFLNHPLSHAKHRKALRQACVSTVKSTAWIAPVA